MTEVVELPLWLVVAGGALAVWTLISSLLLPGVRWFFRKRFNRLIDDLNKKLHLGLPAITLTKRQVLLDRLIYDPDVIDAVTEFCDAEQVPREAAMASVERYAREIVPAFNAYLYFRVANWVCKRVATLLYRVRLGYVDEEGIKRIEPSASIVFVINHRSNMDYLLVTYLAMQSTALSYAVGEWARVWPVQQLIRSMGAYFVRRGSGNKLYRRVLSRYVQMAVSGGVTQAIFPEGGLSRDGLLREPRIGLLDYMLRDFDRAGKLDLVFVPVGLNYDRVLDDRTLLIGNDPSMQGATRGGSVGTALKFIGQQIWLMLRRRWYRNGYACVSFGTPLSLGDYLDKRDWNLRGMDQTRRGEHVKQFASALMAEVQNLIPVLPVALICHVLLEQPLRARAPEEITARAMSLIGDLESRGVHVYLPRTDYGDAVEAGLRMVRIRRFVTEENGQLKLVPEEETIVRYYANSIAHLYPAETIDDEPSAAPVHIAQPG